jgi:dUTP pyrophosphatase
MCDSDFRGECKAIIVNHSNDWVTIRPLDRICQWVPAQVIEVELSLATAELSSTERGAGGFGSSGKQ